MALIGATTALVAATTIAPTEALSATITVHEPDGEGRVFVDVVGTINDEDFKTFKEKTDQIYPSGAGYPRKQVIVTLVSYGGSINPALQIGDLIRKRGLSTFVPGDRTCASACALIWLAGVPRTVGDTPQIGFHAIYDPTTRQPTGAGNAVAGAYLRDLGVGYKAIAFMTRKGPTSVEWLTPDLTKELGVAWAKLQPPRAIPMPSQLKLQPSLQAPAQIIAAWSYSARSLAPQQSPTATAPALPRAAPPSFPQQSPTAAPAVSPTTGTPQGAPERPATGYNPALLPTQRLPPTPGVEDYWKPKPGATPAPAPPNASPTRTTPPAPNQRSEPTTRQGRDAAIEAGRLAAYDTTWPAPAPPAATRPKIINRIEPESPQALAPPAPAPGAQAAPTAAQKVVLYEEDPADPNGKRFVGSVIWRTAMLTTGLGQPPELAIRADVEVPERNLAMTWTLRRNTNKGLPATHTVEIMLLEDFPAGSISNISGILMKQAESTPGVPLAGLAVEVTPGFYRIGLSNLDADKGRNLQLLKERGWFDIPVVYNNNRRAILAIEKGAPGERVFADAFKAWNQ
jgi:hypothetical protein